MAPSVRKAKVIKGTGPKKRPAKSWAPSQPPDSKAAAKDAAQSGPPGG